MKGPGDRFTSSHAVVIGVNEYRHGVPPLQNAVRDALQIGRTLGVDHRFSVQGLFDAAATSASLRALVAEELPARVGPGDRIVVYIASHGLTLPSNDGPNGFLLFHDAIRDVPATFMPMRELHDGLAALRCRHLLLILDCCFAGTFRWAALRDVIVPKQVFRETFDRYVESPAWQVVTSAASDQKALDVFGDRVDVLDHSPFAAALLEGLAGRADLDGDGLLTATELYLHARKQVELVTDGSWLQSPGLFPLRRHERGEFVFQVPERPLVLPAAPALTAELNPYRGLESFDEGSRGLFFGRERELRQLARAVLAQRLTAVVGPSGCGKSSLVKAGLVPMFRAREAATGERRWSIVGPIRALDAVLGRLTDEDLPAGNALVVIDQLEDLLTQAVTDAQRLALLALLARWSAIDRVRLVVTARSDYEPQLQRGAWSAAWRTGRFVVAPMSQDQLRRAIEEPAAARDLYFKPARIVDDLINEVVQMPGALPLLSFTLSELYRCYFERHGEDRAITEQDVDAVGGVTRALTLRATSVVDELARIDPACRATAARVMLRMVATAGPEPARRRVPLGELVYEDVEETARAQRLLDRLVAARLLVTGSEPDGQAYVEPAHDGLIRGWDRLAEWRTESEEHFALVRALGVAASTWSHGKDQGFLWHADPRLPQLVALTRSASHPLNRLELAFVSRSARRRHRRLASIAGIVVLVIAALSGVRLAALQARDDATTQSEQARRQRANALVALAPTLADPLQGALVLTEIEGESPPGWQAAMVARRMAIQSLPLSAQRPTSNEIQALSLHPAGHHLLARASAGDAWLMSVDGRRAPLALRGSSPVIDARFAHGGGSNVLALSRDGSAALWSVDRRAVSTRLPGAGRPAISCGLAADRAAIGHDDGTIRVYGIDAAGSVVSSFTLSLPSRPGGRLLVSANAARAISIAPDEARRQLAISALALRPGAEVVTLGHLELTSLPGAGGADAPGVFLSDDGARLTIHTLDRTRRTWELDTMRLVVTGERELRYPDAGDGDARCFGRAVASGDALVWGECGEHKLSRQEPPRPDPMEDPDPRASFGPAPLAFGGHPMTGEAYALAGAGDGSALLWRLGRGEASATFMRRFHRHGAGVSAVALRPDLELAATASRDGEIRVWSMDDPLVADALGPSFFTDGQHVVGSTLMGSMFQVIGDDSEPRSLPGPGGAQMRGAWFGGDGASIIAAYEGGRTCAYRTRPLALEHCCELDRQPTAALRSSDGSRLWVGYEDGAATTCELATGKLTELVAGAKAPSLPDVHAEMLDPDAEYVVPDVPMPVRKRVVGFAPDANGVVVAHLDGTLARAGIDGAVMALPANAATIAATSDDGSLIATVSAEGHVQIHRAGDGWSAHELGRHIGEVTDLAITRDGHRVLSCTAGSVCNLWDVDTAGDRQVFWPRGRWVGMSRDGDFVVTADRASFLVWSPARPGMPIELGREDLPGLAASAHLSADGRHLVSIWSDAMVVLDDHVIPVQRLAIWRMDWREIVRDLRSRTTACLSPEHRAALLDDSADEARATHGRCLRRHAHGPWPFPLASPPAPRGPVRTPDRPIPSPVRVSTTSGHVTRVIVDDSPGGPSGAAFAEELHAEAARGMWDALAEEVRRIGGVRLDRSDPGKLAATYWTPAPLDVGRIEHYEDLVGFVHAESTPADTPWDRLLLECRSSDRRDDVALVSTPLAASDLFDLDALRAGRPAAPAAGLLDLISFACAQVSTVYSRPLGVSKVHARNGALPLPPGMLDEVKRPRDRRTAPEILAGRIAYVAGDRGRITEGVFAKLFGHPPRVPMPGDD